MIVPAARAVQTSDGSCRGPRICCCWRQCVAPQRGGPRRHRARRRSWLRVVDDPQPRAPRRWGAAPTGAEARRADVAAVRVITEDLARPPSLATNSGSGRRGGVSDRAVHNAARQRNRSWQRRPQCRRRRRPCAPVATQHRQLARHRRRSKRPHRSSRGSRRSGLRALRAGGALCVQRAPGGRFRVRLPERSSACRSAPAELTIMVSCQLILPRPPARQRGRLVALTTK